MDVEFGPSFFVLGNPSQCRTRHPRSQDQNPFCRRCQLPFTIMKKVPDPIENFLQYEFSSWAKCRILRESILSASVIVLRSHQRFACGTNGTSMVLRSRGGRRRTISPWQHPKGICDAKIEFIQGASCSTCGSQDVHRNQLVRRIRDSDDEQPTDTDIWAKRRRVPMSVSC